MLGGGFPLLIRISGSEGGKKEIGPQKQAQILFKYQVLIWNGHDQRYEF